ncbi:hypothetical protein K505DRAFT_380661 [Melanomma pulvis-pyrius CBS 109.77]|uniref:DUF6594 domain-containing protein n=1 Tax=Melanomma pulvis-pyrius CBS 109.77 TaxID=1314802 RepID=A0A6A6WPI4_9PLEO|nr:hypothetical protein K505DRAFT_380661 [Melanomma pulvis-pyrius CBS 109.77]
MANLAINPSFQQPRSIPPISADDPGSYVQGYPKLAYFFSQCPRYLHLRSFSALSVRVQLYRQHDLILLEQRLLELERGTSSGGRSHDCKDYASLKYGSDTNERCEHQKLYETIKIELKEYEDSLIRTNLLASRGWDNAGLRNVQRYLTQKEGCGLSLTGADASLWGSAANPSGHASDLIQVVQQVEPSVTGRFLNDKFVLWVPQFPRWLRLLLFWSRKKTDVFNQYSYSARTFENVSLGLGNIVTSLLVYAAVTLLYLSTGRALKTATVILIAVIVTASTILFKNQQFVAILATVCAVLVTLLANDSKSGTAS